MPDIIALISKISAGEDSTVEFKAFIQTKHLGSIADEIAAFANSKSGGMLLVGVDDSGNINGLSPEDIKKTEQLITEICIDSIQPAIQFLHTETIAIGDKWILKIEIPPGAFVHKSSGGYFIRVGSSKREMLPEQLARLFQSRSQAGILHFNEQPVPETGLHHLQEEKYRHFISAPRESGEDIKTRLQKRRLLARQDDRWTATVAGILMCNDAPRDFLYNSYIQAVCYRHTVKDANYQTDARDFTDSLDKQITGAYEFAEKHNHIAARKSGGRTDYPKFDMQAVLEGLTNAVVHRDYSRHESHIRFFIFSDRLEICSPGALANTLTVEDLPHNQVTRNELLARLLSELSMESGMQAAAQRKKFLERRGEGVGIILENSRRLSGRLPQYQMRGEELHLTIYAAFPPEE